MSVQIALIRGSPLKPDKAGRKIGLSMSKKVMRNEILSSLGTAFEIIKKISDAIRALGGTDEDLRRIITESALAKQIAELIMADSLGVSKTYQVIVDYSKSMAKMISLGNYDWASEGLTQGFFPIKKGTGSHKVKLVLVHFDKSSSTNDILAYLDAMALTPASIEHLLAFGEQYPEIQKKFRIIALGSVYDVQCHHYPTLNYVLGNRRLDATWDQEGFWRDCRFLAVQE